MNLPFANKSWYKDLFEKYNIIAITMYGSRLYGNYTEDSDYDIKGVFIPSKREILIGPRNDNISFKEEEDNAEVQLISIHAFIDLLLKGDPMAISMLNANEESILYRSAIFSSLMNAKSQFYTSDMTNMFGFAKSQVMRYSNRAHQYAAIQGVIDALSDLDPEKRLYDVRDTLHFSDLAYIIPSDCPEKHPHDFYYICGRKYSMIMRVCKLKGILEESLSRFSERAKSAAVDNDCVDWKSIAHAVRIATEIIEIYQTGNITYPCKAADFFLRIKKGEFDYKANIEPLIESLFATINIYKDMYRGYPEETDREKWKDWLECILEREIKDGSI